MWLINTSTLKLENFIDPGSDGISYAILSHTWEEEEVSFQEFANLETAKIKQGFAKIAKTCELAKSESYKYAWVDTCCIDKSSSAELSEAINSMYEWYRASSVCYAFLADIITSDPFERLPSNYTSLSRGDLRFYYGRRVPRTSFANSRWFSRGWTLQELIAPSELMFYDARWNPINDKRSLRHVLELITLVDEETLVDSTKVVSKSVWERMSWAAERDTTRVEDIAYCMLGIFDVSMPLIYGEGYKAFQRLQEEITRKTGDVSILLWSSTSMPLPKYRPSHYRRALTPPLYRGVFAWAPSEFVKRSDKEDTSAGWTEIRYNPALPVKLELGADSSVFARGLKYWTIRNYAGETEHVMVLIPFNRTTSISRPVKWMTAGYAFTGGGIPAASMVVKVDDFRFLGQHVAAVMDTVKIKNVYLAFDQRTDQGAELPVWPSHRWEPHQCRFVYTESEVSNCGRLKALLGLAWWKTSVRWVDSKSGELKVQELEVLCAAFSSGYSNMTKDSRLPRLLATPFIRGSCDSMSSKLHSLIQQENGDRADLVKAAAYLDSHFAAHQNRAETPVMPDSVRGVSKVSSMDAMQIACGDGREFRLRVLATVEGPMEGNKHGFSYKFQLIPHIETAEGSWTELAFSSQGHLTLSDAMSLREI